MTNDQIADQMERSSPDPTQFLLAHLVRLGRMEMTKDLHEYSTANNLDIPALVLAHIEACVNDITAYIDPKTDQLQAVDRLTHCFKQTLTRTLALYRISQILGGNDE